MNTLKQAFYNSVRDNDYFLELINDYAAEGYVFYSSKNPRFCFVDAKMGAAFGYSNSHSINLTEDTSFYTDFLGRIIKAVNDSLEGGASLEPIKSVSIGDNLYNTYLFFSTHKEVHTSKEYVLLAVHSSQYLKKQNPLSLFSETLDLAAWQCNIQTGELFVNENWANLIGYNLKELEPTSFDTFAKLTHPEDVDLVNNILAKYSVGEITEYRCELRMKHKNGYWVWLLSRGKTISKSLDGKVEWMIGSHIDITDRKTREQEADFLALVPVNTFNSIIISNADGSISYVNKAFENLTGYSTSEVIGKKPGQFLQGPNTRKKDILNFRRNLQNGKSFRQKILNYTKSGREYINSCHVDPVYNEDGDIIRYISIQQDITKEVRAHEYLATFKTTLDQTDDCIFIFDGETLAFTYVNKGAVEMMEYAEPELLGLHPYDIKPEYPIDKFAELIHPLKIGAVSSKRFKTLHRLKSGKDIPVEVFLQYIKDGKSKPHFIAIVQDITERLVEKGKLELLSLVAEHTTNLVIVTDAKGYTEFVNEAFVEKTGYSLEEIKGKKPGTLLHGPKTNPQDIKANRAGLRRKESFTQEILNYTKSGDTYWVSITFNPIFNENNELVNFVAIETDITDRRAQEEKLKVNEERLQLVLKGSEIGYWDWDAKTGEMMVNDRWYEMLGYKSTDFKASIDNWHSLVHPDDIVILEDLMESVIPDPNKTEFSAEIRAQHKAGHYIWILDKGAVVERNKDGSPCRISGTHMEVTERKILENELEEERKFLNNIINVNALSLVIINKLGEITFANTGAENVLGLKKEVVEKKKYNDPDWRQITLDDQPFPQEELPFVKVIKTRKPVEDIQHGLIWKDGTKKYISITGVPFTTKDGEVEDIIFSVFDITERVTTQKKLDEHRDQIENVFKNVSDVIWSVSLPDYLPIFISPSIENITGYPPSFYLTHLKGKKWELDVCEKDEHVIDQIYSDLEEKGYFDTEYRIYDKDKNVKWVQNKGTIIRQSGEPDRLDGFMADITRRKENEFEIQRYLKIVEDQNERLKNFTYIVSHNLRSHSANIQGLMYLIDRKNPEIAENQYVKLLHTASNKLDDTLHHLNSVVSVVSSAEQFKKINLSEALTAFIDTFENYISEAKISVILEVSQKVEVEAVPAFLESIITNLMTNAIKYKDPAKKNAYIKITSRSLNGIVIVSFQDNGLGIDLDKYGAKLFGMYKTFHTNENSRGLGLFLTKNQLESMGGKIEVESTLGEGSTFKIFLKDGSIQ